MPTLLSAPPSPLLRPYVRAYAQRKLTSIDLPLLEAVPAQLEQVLNFELGVMPGIHHRECKISSGVWIGGAQTVFPGHMQLWPGVESFAIFFQPAGWSQLFGIPMREITNRIIDAELVSGKRMRHLWNSLGEATSFEQRVAVVERVLLAQLNKLVDGDGMAEVANLLFRQHGALRIPQLASRHLLSVRQFERKFQQETGASPKTFARVARFQAAVDAKLSSPKTSWIDIAHRFGYYDQMHMVRDFAKLGQKSPTQLILELGDVRPPALAEAA